MRTQRSKHLAAATLLLAASVTLTAAAAPVAQAAPAPVDRGYGATVTLSGRGFGHGIGMGQVGAYGYAVKLGWAWDQILAHYYGGTTLGPSDPNQAFSVRLSAGDDDPVTAVIQDRGALATSATGAEQYRAAAAVEVAPGSYNVYARTDAVNCPGATTAAEFEAPGSPWVKKAAGVNVVDFSVVGVDTSSAPVTSLLGVCERPSTDQFDPGIHARYYRGAIRAVNGTQGENRTVNLVPLDRYVQGVVPREMPAAWGNDGGGAGLHALRAQAVAARSYGLAQNRYTYAKTCDTQSCQVYGGAGYRAAVNVEDGGPTPMIGNESPLSNQATADTAGVVLLAGGAVVSAMYSASSGGYTNDSGAFPAVPDEGDQYSPLPDRHTWTATLAVAAIEAAYPQIGSLQLLRVTARNGLGEDGGRVRSMDVIGTAATVTVTGLQFQSQFGLRSDWFTVPNACDGRVVPPLAAPAPVAAAKFQPVTPARLLDTRAGIGTGAVPLAANCSMALPVVGVGGVPATGVAAVALNITATQADSPGFLTVYPCGQPQPPTSTVNYAANQNVANMAQVRVGAGNQVCIFTMSKVDVVVDVLGWYGTGATAGYAPLTPARLLDTRDGTGIGGHRAAVPAGGTTAFTVAGVAGVPADAAGVMLNVTATEEGADGYVTVYPCGGAVPPSSTVNYRAGRDVANQAVSAIGAGGQVCVSSFATGHVVVDVLGWYGPSAPAGYVPLTPSRVLDTRQPSALASGKVPAGGVLQLPVLGQGGIPATGVGAAAINVTVDQPSGPGFVTAFPCGGSPPLASNLNYGGGQVVANLATTPVPASGAICLYTWAATNLVVDVSGYFTS
jgi:peptidoglycan hydrolase-like amidase